MKIKILLICSISFFWSCSSYNFLKKAIILDSPDPSLLFVQIESPEYKGIAMIPDYYLRFYYSEFDSNYKDFKKEKKNVLNIYNDIKNNTIYTIFSPTLFVPLYDFDSSIYLVANQGIDFFISTFFDENQHIKDTSSRKWQIAKLMFDAGIHLRMYESWSGIFIDDPRFYSHKKNGKSDLFFPNQLLLKIIPIRFKLKLLRKDFVIPNKFLRKGENWYKNTWLKQPKKPIYFQYNIPIKLDSNYQYGTKL